MTNEQFMSLIDAKMRKMSLAHESYHNSTYFWNVIRPAFENKSFLDLVKEGRRSVVLSYFIERRKQLEKIDATTAHSAKTSPIILSVDNRKALPADFKYYSLEKTNVFQYFYGKKIWTDDFCFFIDTGNTAFTQIPIRLVKSIWIQHKQVFP